MVHNEKGQSLISKYVRIIDIIYRKKRSLLKS